MADLFSFFAVLGVLAAFGALLELDRRRDERRWKRKQAEREAAGHPAE